MNLRQKLLYIRFQDVPKSPKFFNKNIEFSHMSQRNVTAANPLPPPKKTHPHTHPKVQMTFFVGKIDMRGYPK